MKQTALILLFILFFVNSKAQQMSIEFSIEWQNALNFNLKGFENKNIHPAYLNITYRNISDKSLYCLKVADGKFDLPQIIHLTDVKYPANPKERFPYPDKMFQYHKKGYLVGFKSNPVYQFSLAWNIRMDTTFLANKTIPRPNLPYPISGLIFSDEDDMDYSDVGRIIGDTTKYSDNVFMDIDLIYNFIYRHYYPIKQEQTGEEQWYHYSKDITGDTIMSNSINRFVFLKPGEIHTDKYNLIGFQITGGTFTFQLDDTKSLDYVDIEPVYKDEDKVFIDHFVKKQLPLKIGEYELFEDNFLTNKVTVHFPEVN